MQNRRLTFHSEHALTLIVLLWCQTATPAILYVDQHSPEPKAPYTNAANAAHSIQSAVDAAYDGDELYVSPGIYSSGANGEQRVNISKRLAVRSAQGPLVTIIEGNRNTPKEPERIDWFVDSRFGSDDNAGTNMLEPLSSIAALQTKGVQSGQVIGLARGSWWREQLTIPVSGVSVIAYGEGERPLLDCSDTVTNAWDQLDGTNNVYQTTCYIPDVGALANFVSVWVDSHRLERARTVAECGSKPRSYTVSSDISRTFTLYINLGEGQNPAAHLVEYSSRLYGIDGRVYAGVTNTYLKGLWTRRNYCNNGSLVFTGIAEDCVASEGSKHNVLSGPGSILRRVVANEAYYPDAGILFVFNADRPTYQPMTYEDCVAMVSSNSPASPISGWYGHPNYGGNFGTVTYRRCVGFGLQYGILSVATNTQAINCAITNRPDGIAAIVASGPLTIENSILHSDSQHAIVINDKYLMLSGSLIAGRCAYGVVNQGLGVSAVGNTFANPHTAIHSLAQPLSLYSNSFLGARSVSITSTNFYEADYNHGNAAGSYMYLFYPLEAWRRLTGAELHAGSPPPRPELREILHPPGSTRCALVAGGAILDGFTLRGGDAGLGGGAYCFGPDAVLANCILTGNRAMFGGACFDGTLKNCTIVQNEAALGGGVSGTIGTNCIVYYNMAPQGSDVYHGQLSYSCVPPTNSLAGSSNIPGPPGFEMAFPFRLAQGSQCIDAGTELPALFDRRALDGDGDGIPGRDMGAIEFNPYRIDGKLGRTGMVLRIFGEPSRTALVYRSRDLIDWEPFVSIMVGDTPIQLTDPLALTTPQMFYRLKADVY